MRSRPTSGLVGIAMFSLLVPVLSAIGGYSLGAELKPRTSLAGLDIAPRAAQWDPYTSDPDEIDFCVLKRPDGLTENR